MSLILCVANQNSKINKLSFDLGLSEICKGLVINYLTIVAPFDSNITDIDEFLQTMHSSNIRTTIFFDVDKYLLYIEQNHIESVEMTSLIFSKPDLLIQEVY